jgi:hypothetical protein
MRCKAGDLAVVVSSIQPENIGLFVDIVEPYAGEMMFVDEQERTGIWECRARGKIAYESIEGKRLLLTIGPIPDRCLRPIRPGQKAPVSSVTGDKQAVCAI